MMNSQKITDKIITNIESSDLLYEPFVHKFVENVLPQEFYEEILLNLPEKSDYPNLLESGRVGKDYSKERYLLDLGDKNVIQKFSNEKKIFVEKLIEIFLSPRIFQSVSKIFFSTLKNRFQNFSDEEKKLYGENNFKFDIGLSLVKDFTKYSLDVHTDSKHKFLTFLFYLPKDNSLSDFGTTLYKAKFDKIVPNKIHFSQKETKEFFEPIKKCPFVPNSLLVFPRTNQSYHGVELVNIHQQERDLLLLNYHLKEI